MGNCTSKPNSSEINPKGGIPDFIYLSRSKGKLLLIKSNKVQKLSLPSSLFYSKDSAISLLSKQRLILIGGTFNSSLISTCSIFSLSTKEVKIMPEVPFQCKGGQIHEIGEWIYYLGGQTSENNELVQASIARLSQKQNIWQEIKEPQRTSSTFKFSSLMNFGSCVMDKKIFIFGGKRFNKLGNLKASDLILSLTVDQGFLLKTEAKMPFKVCSPLVASGDKHGIVVGGTDPKDGSFNKACFYVVLKDNVLKPRLIEPLNMEFKESYPPLYTQDYSVFVSYPNVAVRFKDKNFWKTFHIKPKKNIKPRRPRIDLRVSVEPVQVVVNEKNEEIFEERDKKDENFEVNKDYFEKNKGKRSKSNSSKSSRSSKSSKPASSKLSKTSSKVSKSSSKSSKISSKSAKSSLNPSKSSSKSSRSSLKSSKSSISDTNSLKNHKEKSKMLLEDSMHSNSSLNLSISTGNKALSMQSGLSISNSSSAFPHVNNPETPKDRVLLKTKTPDLKQIQTGENLAHKITVLKENEGNQSSRFKNKKIVIIEKNDHKSSNNESSSSSSSSQKSRSSSSGKSSSSSSKSSKSSQRKGNIASFLNIDSQNLDRRESQEKINNSSGFGSGIEEQMKAYKESVNQNMKYRPTSPAIPINSLGIDLKLPVISTPKSSVIRSESSSLLEDYKTYDSLERKKSDSLKMSEPQHPSTDRPSDIYKPNSRFIVKNVIRSEKNSIRLTPKSSTVKVTKSSSSSSSEDSGPETPTKVTGLYVMPEDHAQILSPVPEFQIEDSICVHENQENPKSEKNEDSESGLIIQSDSYSNSDSSSSEDSDSSNSSSSSSLNRKRMENKAKRLKSSVRSVDSSDVSDTENDESISFEFAQGQKFLQLVSKSLKINPFFSVPSSLNCSDMQKYLRSFVPNREYQLHGELFEVLKEIHEVAGKKPLKEKEKWNIVMASKLLPEIQEVSAEELAFALGRAFKYILMREA
jgi:hypothetical protein